MVGLAPNIAGWGSMKRKNSADQMSPSKDQKAPRKKGLFSLFKKNKQDQVIEETSDTTARYVSAPDPTTGNFAEDDRPATSNPFQKQSVLALEGAEIRAALKAEARTLSEAIEHAAYRPVTSAGQIIRIGISVFWIAIGALLLGAGDAIGLSPAVIFPASPLSDMSQLGGLFAMLGILSAIVIGAQLAIRGRSQVRARENVEGFAASFADCMRHNVERADAVLSTAPPESSLSSEARSLFDIAGDRGAFSALLDETAPRRRKVFGPFLTSLIVITIAGLLGALIYAFGVEETITLIRERAAALGDNHIVQTYPYAAAAMIAGAIVFATAGVLGLPFSNDALAMRRSRLRARAIDLTAAQMKANGATAHIDRLLDTTRVHGAATTQAPVETPKAETPQSDLSLIEDPAWRKRDSSIRFVDTGFQAAPKTWRTDAFSQKFHAKPDSKRRLS